MFRMILMAASILSAVANAKPISTFGLKFEAPTVDGIANVSNPRIGEIAFDSSGGGTFYGNYDGTTSGWAPLGVTAFSVVTASSGTKTPTATGRFHAMTGNSLSLPPGTWRLSGIAYFSSSGGSPGYTNIQAGWYGANGADSGTTPTLLGSTSNITVLSAGSPNHNSVMLATLGTDVSLTVQNIIVETTATVSVYLVPYSEEATAANGRISVYATAERIE